MKESARILATNNLWFILSKGADKPMSMAQTNQMAKWLSVRLRTKWLWVRVPL